MAQQTIGIGAAANDGTGDTIRNAFDKANSNFTELYAALADFLTGTEFGRSLLTLADAAALLNAAGAQAASTKLDTLASITPIADGDYTVGSSTITTQGGLITAIA